LIFKTAYRAGIKPAEFWDQTPYETRLCVEAYNDIRLDEEERFMHTAWHIGYFTRVKDMPRLSEMLAPYRNRSALKSDVKKNDVPAAPSPGRDPDLSRNLMNALLQFPAGQVPGERVGKNAKPPEAPPA
jgi:hypothetical protein